jgi:hypothetical protein
MSKSILDIQAEFILRKMQFSASDMAYHHYTGWIVNWEGCPNLKNPAIQKLLKKGLIKVSRTKVRYIPTKMRNTNAIARRFTKISLANPLPKKIDITCPGCGNPFVRPYQGKWLIYHNTFRLIDPAPHTKDCPIIIHGE